MDLKHISYIRRLRSILPLLVLRMLWVSVMPKFSYLGRVGVYQCLGTEISRAISLAL